MSGVGLIGQIRLFVAACVALICLSPPSAMAQTSPLEQRIDELIAVIKGTQPLETYFDPRFLSAVPAAQFKTITDGLIAQYGQPVKVGVITTKSTGVASLELMFEKAVGTVEIAVDVAAPHQVIGLLFSGFSVENDDIAAIDAELGALAGRAGYVVEMIDGKGQRRVIAGRRADEQFAIGSIFKLYVLAELAAQIDVGKRKWSDVVPLTRRSFSSLATDGLPSGTPVTLQLLATWMISVSDNAATDELLLLLGRDKVEARIRAIGHSDIDRMLPLLTTVEAFLIKSDHDGLLAAYAIGSETEQRDLLNRRIAGVGFDKIDGSKFGRRPLAIDSVEWFASPGDIVALMDHFRRLNNPILFKIMAQSLAPAAVKKWRYLGTKGGSETGVIAASYLGQRKSGAWIIVAGSWNNDQNAVDNVKFFSLMQRLIDLLADEKQTVGS